jgi:hypothetical protein
MATVNKNFKVKHGLVVEGSTATVNGNQVLSETASDQYIIDLIGGETLITSVSNEFDVSVGGELSIDRATVDAYYDPAGAAAAAQTAAEGFATQAIADLVDGAPALLDTLNELAAALGDDENFASSIATSIGEKQDTLTAGSNIDITGDTISVTGLSTDDVAEDAGNLYFTNQRALDATAAAYDVVGSGAGALQQANDYTDGEITTALTTAQGYADTAQQNAEDYADGLAPNYDPAGTAASEAGAVASDLTDHENATEAHGATGAVVGTTNTQSLSNKTISYVDNTLTVQVANVSDLTATASELNVLDGITASTSELNILDGVTADAAEINLLDGLTASTAELNLLDGVTATTIELNYVDGVTSDIQTQLNDKAPLESPSLTGTPLAPTATPGTNNTQIATTAYADAAVAAIVDGAPDLLNTLNELAAAINDDENFASTLTTLAGEKVAKTGDTMTGLLVLSADPSANLGAATKQYVDAAQTAAEDYADGLASNYDASGSAATAETNANSYTDTEIGLLTTDDIEEGSTNEYFTDARAKTSAADLLTGASLTNITITGTGAGLTITAENGVDDSDTDDLDEGTTNLYFTDVRAVDALEAVVPNFTAVELNSVAKQVAATTGNIATASTVTAYAFAKAEYRSAKFLVKTAYSTHTEVSEVLLTLDTSDNIAITEYAIVGTNGSSMTVSADISGTDVRLRVTTINSNSTVTVMGTLIA